MNTPPGVRVTVSTLTHTEIEPLAEALAAAVRPGRGTGGRTREGRGARGAPHLPTPPAAASPV